MKKWTLMLAALLFGAGCNLEVNAEIGRKPEENKPPASNPPPSTTPPLGKAQLRIAHLSPGAPAVDACIAPRGETGWVGPVLKGNGNDQGVSYGQVTQYLEVEARAWDVRLVAAGASDCSQSVGGLPDITDLPALPDESKVTVAAVGELGGGMEAPFELQAFIDVSEVTLGRLALRFVHASPKTPAVDVGLEDAAGNFTKVFSNIGYGSESGYAETAAALDKAKLAVRVSGQSDDALVISDVSLPANRAATVYAIGKVGDAANPLKALLCLDEKTMGSFSSCILAGVPGAPPMAHVRVAHLSPDAPAIDVCLDAGKGYSGPVFKGAGLGSGLGYKQVTGYLAVPPGKYRVRVVAPGSTNCNTALAPSLDGIALPELKPSTWATAAAIGTLGGGTDGFRLKAYNDDAGDTASLAALRFVHASPGTPAVDVGAGLGLTFTTVFPAVRFGENSTGLAYENGYVAVPAFENAVFSARVAGTMTDALSIGGVSLKAGETATAWAIGLLGNDSTPLEVLICSDARTPRALAACAVVPAAKAAPTLRVAHLSPDAPAVDVCIAARGSGAFMGPVLARRGVGAGLSYPNVTTYLPLMPGAYDVRIVAPNASSCSVALGGLADITDLPAVPEGAQLTIAATGLLAANAHNPFKLRAFVDAAAAPHGQAGLRFIHASPDAPAVDLGLGTGSSFAPLFLDVAYGKAAGYLNRDPIIEHVVFTLRLTGTTHEVLSTSGLRIDAANTATLFAIGTVGGAMPLKAMLCQDKAPASGVLSSCAVAP
jgi:hypothetical protein